MTPFARVLMALAILMPAMPTAIPSTVWAAAGPEASPIPGVPAVPKSGFGGPTAGPESTVKRVEGTSGTAGGNIVFEKIEEDFFATVDLFTNLSVGPVTFGIWAPLRMRVIDEAPEDDDTFRAEDWDQVGDYLRILRFVELNLGDESWRLRGRFGALDGESIGHGTIVSGYYNSLDRDHHQAGLLIDTALKWGGLELMLDNIIDPEVLGLRLHLRPTSFFTDNSWANKLVLGLSFVTDIAAPVALMDGAPGNGDFDPVLQDGLPKVSATTGLTIIGIDLEYQAVQNDIIDLVPYIDLNFMSDEDTSHGLHVGAFFNVQIPGPVGPTMLTRLEYRNLGSHYAPTYINSLYEAQRLQYDASRFVGASEPVPLTKLGFVRQNAAAAHGWLGQLILDFAGWVRVGGTFEDYEGPANGELTLSLIVPKIEQVQFGAHYTKGGIDGAEDAFDLDRALFVAFVTAQLTGPLTTTAVYRRSWSVNDQGEYTVSEEFSAGVGLAFDF